MGNRKGKLKILKEKGKNIEDAGRKKVPAASQLEYLVRFGPNLEDFSSF